MGSTMALRKTDYITSTHRGHGHCIGKGADPKLMFAEFFGKEEGYCRGRGGSMHIADVESGNLGANGIVAGGIPIAVGAALAIKKQRRDDVALCFFGDGATNEGASTRPQHGVDLETAGHLRLQRQQIRHVGFNRTLHGLANVADRASAYNMPGLSDGNRIEEWPSRLMLLRGLEGQVPHWLNARPIAPVAIPEATAHRYRSKEEIEEWKHASHWPFRG